MPVYKAETSEQPKLRAWLYAEGPAEMELDPAEPHQDGWRVVIEYVDLSIRNEPVRSTWMETLAEALQQLNLYFPEAPHWQREDTGEAVDLNAIAGYRWEKMGPQF